MFATIGRFSHRRRWYVVVAWLALLVLGFTVGSQVFNHLSESQGSASSESVEGYEVISDFAPTQPGVMAVVDGADVADPVVESAVSAVATEVAALPYVTDVQTAYGDQGEMLASPDGTASIIMVSLEAEEDMAAAHERIEELREVLHGSVPGAEVLVGGDEPVMRDSMVTTQQDLMQGQMIVLPVLLVALLLVFRGWRAAVLPLFGAVVTVAGALLLLLAATRVIDVASYAVDVVALFGLALAVDYSLLMVSRFREERAVVDDDVATAVERTVEAAGRTVTYSAMTVIASLAGLLVFDNAVFTSLAVGGIATVLIALLAGITLVPAMLSIWGRRIKPETRAAAGDGAFGRLARRVQRRPLLVAGGVTAVLVAAGLPFLGINYSNGDHRVLPTSMESRQATDVMVERFPGMGTGPVQVVGRAAAADPRVEDYAAWAGSLEGVEAVSVAPLGSGTSVVSVFPAGETQDTEAQEVVEQLRAERPDYESWVTGQAAFLVDFEDHIGERLPWAVALIALATFVLLFLMTGSVLVPLKALVMNTLSLGATFGALVLIFQDGHLSGLMGFSAFGAIEVWVPIVVFVFAFGLSMDYEVFLLSRVKECYDECGNSDNAVANGLQRSGRIITSAAVLVMIAFMGFALGDNLGIKEMGVALTIAVLVDVTLVRTLLVPATMTLLGNANWWAPAWLRRVHDRYGLHEAPSTAGPAPAPVTLDPVAAQAPEHHHAAM